MEEISGLEWGLDWQTGFVTEARVKIYRYCIQSVLLYCSETWKLSVDEVRLRGVKHCMIKMMCGTRLTDRVSSADQHQSWYR